MGTLIPDTPHVNSGGISTKLEEKLGRSIPSRDHKRRVIPFGLTSAFSGLRWWLIIRSSKPKICYLKDAFIANEEIRRLGHISQIALTISADF